MAKSFTQSNHAERRYFLKRAGACAIIAALHPIDLFSAIPSVNLKAFEPRIAGLKLFTAQSFDAMKAFYIDKLGGVLVSESKMDMTVRVGLTPITFLRAPDSMGDPWYHVAFNIPENKISEALTWQSDRSEVILTPERMRISGYPDEVRHFRNWNAHSIFFWDPAGNLLEYIARHELDNASGKPFSDKDIHYASEIAFVVDDQHQEALKLHNELALNVYPQGERFWWAMGDETGLLLTIPKRMWGENTPNPKRFQIFPTEATIKGDITKNYSFKGFPDYHVKVISN